MMLNHPVTEHLPKDVASELRQCGIDEQVLFLQRFGKGAAWSGILLLHPCVFHESGDNFQGTYRFIQRGGGLLYLFWYGTQHDLPRGLRVPEIHPVEGRVVVRVGGSRHFS